MTANVVPQPRSIGISLEKIISGGQTGADRGALDAAIALGIPHGGFAPRGRRAEDGEIPRRYLLTEMTSASYVARTEANVRAADATLVLVHGQAGLAKSPGSRLTIRTCRKVRTRWWAADPRREEHVERVVAWLRGGAPRILNVAGSRESTSPGIQAQTQAFLEQVLVRLRSVE